MTTSRRFPITDIQRAVQDCLKTSPRVVDELERITGYSAASIRVCLARLEEAKVIYRERIGIKRAAGYYYLWHFGAAPEASATKIIVKDYEPNHVRDPLVEALFGVARKGVKHA